MEKVSVVTPVFNKGKYLDKTIQSVLNQTFTNFEYILINDGSTDNSKEIIMNYVNRDSRVRYLEHNNRGVSYSRNLGIVYARSRLISFLDADDAWDATFLQKMVSKINGYDACFCGHYYQINERLKKARLDFECGDFLEKYLYGRCTPNTNSWLIRKDFLQAHKIEFDEFSSLGEDMDFFSRVLFCSKRISFVPEHLTYYNRNVEGSLNENSFDKISRDIHWMMKLREYINENEIDQDRKKRLIRAIETYRIPAAIVYRTNVSPKNHYPSDTSPSMRKYLDQFEFTNGLRSFKLFFYLVRLQLLCRMKDRSST